MKKLNKPISVDAYVLDHLKRNKSVTTFDFRKQGIFHPAGSVSRLRELGYDIKTTLTTVIDEHGISHKNVARYSLKPSAGKGGVNE